MTATVLLVDDDRTLVEVVALMLKRTGFETRVAHDGVRALQILNTEPIDLVVLDVMLPGMDGFELCRRIRAQPRAGHLPILMLSARSQVNDRLEGFEAGADDYVAKPVAVKEIVTRVRTLLTRFQRARRDLPRLMTFIGAKGGVGNTTLALNVAATLLGSRPKVVLVELGGVGVSAARMLGLSPQLTLLDLGSGSLSLDDLERCVLVHGSGLRYIPGYARELPSAAYVSGLLGEVVGQLLTHYDMTIVDLGPTALGASADILARSSLIIPVTEHEELSIWHLQALLGHLERRALRDRVPGFVLVERVPNSTSVSVATIAHELGLEALAIVPPAAEALRFAHSCQQPLYLLRPENPASLVVAQLSRRLTMTRVELPDASERPDPNAR